ncbi:MAG: hypothetical protein ACOCV3_02150 [Halanaerobiales bacterium]
MDLFLLILFFTVGIAGLVFNSDVGVFIGMGLVPWQILKLRIGKRYNLIAIILTSIAGGIYFIIKGYWLLLLLFIFIEFYNLWGYSAFYGQLPEKEEQIKDNS